MIIRTHINMGVMGVAIDGCERTGAICGECAVSLIGRDDVTLFRIKRGKRPCDACTELKRRLDDKVRASIKRRG